ncbi:hypothetical protein EYF80_041994 [Liparis tanakae]|uniref:Uncharacterized protein n=1 Tax=Liparis tanakae TaxID=230148 RepID=A0A4Z2G2P0_9TELE|nr:hypothetical protein EYF80_041994 [Liparis tanakae]
MCVLVPDLQEEEALRRLLDQLIRDVLGLEPGGEAFAVLILEAEEPGLPQPDRLDYLDVPMGTTITFFMF